jgi:hypothetical protein
VYDSINNVIAIVGTSGSADGTSGSCEVNWYTTDGTHVRRDQFGATSSRDELLTAEYNPSDGLIYVAGFFGPTSEDGQVSKGLNDAFWTAVSYTTTNKLYRTWGSRSNDRVNALVLGPNNDVFFAGYGGPSFGRSPDFTKIILTIIRRKN